MYNLDLYILGESGARTAFVGNWLAGKLITPHYDVGANIQNASFDKGHNCGVYTVAMKTPEQLQEYKYKVAIVTDTARLDTLLYLFADKNTEHDFDDSYTHTHLKAIAIDYLNAAEQLDLSLFNSSITFSETFDNDVMIDLYVKYNNRLPSDIEVLALQETNKLNDILLDRNHVCSKIRSELIDKNRKRCYNERMSTS